MLSHRENLTVQQDIAANLDTCIREVRQVAQIGQQIIFAIADLKATFLKVAENPTQQNR